MSLTESKLSELLELAKAALAEQEIIDEKITNSNCRSQCACCEDNLKFNRSMLPAFIVELIERVRKAESVVRHYESVVAGEALKLSSGDILVVKLAAKWVNEHNDYRHYRENLMSMLPKGVSAIITAEGVDFAALDDEKLANIGLMKKIDNLSLNHFLPVAINKIIYLANQGNELVKVDAQLVTLSNGGKSVTVDAFGRVTWLDVKDGE